MDDDKPRCGNCLYFFADTSPTFPDAEGVCRRHAPRGPVVLNTMRDNWQLFPPTAERLWCGEYEPAKATKERTQPG